MTWHKIFGNERSECTCGEKNILANVATLRSFFPRKIPLVEWSEAERNRAGNFSEMEKIWVEWSSLTSEHFLLQKRLTHRLLSRMTARYTSVCERSGRTERNRKVAVKSCRLRSGRYEERSDEEYFSYRALGLLS